MYPRAPTPAGVLCLLAAAHELSAFVSIPRGTRMEEKPPKLGPRLIVVVFLILVLMLFQLALIYRDMNSEHNTTGSHHGHHWLSK